MMHIRKMTIADYDALYTLWMNTPELGMRDTDDSRDGIAVFLTRNPNTCFVAEEDGDVVGTILGGHDGRRALIYHMAVEVSKRKSGIGSALLNRVEEALKKEGITRAYLMAFAENQTGNAFWENHGFTQREDLVLRNKSLNM